MLPQHFLTVNTFSAWSVCGGRGGGEGDGVIMVVKVSLWKCKYGVKFGFGFVNQDF